MLGIDFSKPGMHDIPFPMYERDPCPEAAMRKGHARLILERTPANAWQAHPRLNEDWRPTHDKKFDLGVAAHSLVVGGDSRVIVCDAKDWRSKEARAIRDQAYAEGNTPILESQAARVSRMRGECIAQLTKAGGDFANVFGHGGLREQSIFYTDGKEGQEVWCAVRLDWFRADTIREIWDYKTTTNIAAWSRIAFNTGADIQAEMMRRAVCQVNRCSKEQVAFHWVIQETEPPHLIDVASLTPAGWSLAEMKVDAAVDRWGQCMRSKRWPGYSLGRVRLIDPPTYHETAMMEQIGL